MMSLEPALWKFFQLLKDGVFKNILKIRETVQKMDSFFFLWRKMRTERY